MEMGTDRETDWTREGGGGVVGGGREGKGREGGRETLSEKEEWGERREVRWGLLGWSGE